MTVRSADSTFAGMRAPNSESGQDPSRVGILLYQGATILAILLFLISFWSC